MRRHVPRKMMLFLEELKTNLTLQELIRPTAPIRRRFILQELLRKLQELLRRRADSNNWLSNRLDALLILVVLVLAVKSAHVVDKITGQAETRVALGAPVLQRGFI